MSTQTEHLKLDLREAADIFNPLSTNANFESLDNIIYEIQTKGGVPTYTTTASANLLKLSSNPTPNETVFKFVAAGDANTWSYQETINNIVDLSGAQKTVKAGNMYVAWVNSANAMVVIAWPDVVNAQTFDGKGPAEWATTAQLQAVNTTAANATQTAQAAATVANNALEVAQAAGMKMKQVWTNAGSFETGAITWNRNNDAKFLIVTFGEGLLQNLETMAVIVPNKTAGSGAVTKSHVTYDGRIILVSKPYTLTSEGITFKSAYYAEIYTSTSITQSEGQINIKSIYECS